MVATGVILPIWYGKIPGKLVRKTDGINIIPVGSTVKAIADGKVIYAGEVDGEQLLVVQHGKYFSGYNHLSNVSVSAGQEVKKVRYWVSRAHPLMRHPAVYDHER